MRSRMNSRALLGPRQGVAHDVERDTGDLDVHLQSGDALVGAGHLEVHVAQVVFHPGDVGEHHVVVALFDETHGDAGHRAGDRHAGVHQSEGRGADAGHRAGAVGFQSLGDQTDGIGELLFIRAPPGARARSARAPWPISRRPGPRMKPASPTLKGGNL